MRISFEIVYDQGNAQIKEDEEITNFPYFGVVDGISEARCPFDGKPVLYNGMTGGQMVCYEIQNAVLDARRLYPPKDIIREANRIVGVRIAKKKIHPDCVDEMPGAHFALCRIGEETTEVIQAGDSFVVILFRNGEFAISPSQTFRHDAFLLEALDEIKRKKGCDRKEIWAEFLPVLKKMRRKNINQPHSPEGFGLLNGQKALEEMWWQKQFPTKYISFMMFFTDGLATFRETGNEARLAEKFLRIYQQGGLMAILEKTRKIQREEERKVPLDHLEATAIAVKIVC